MPVWLLILNTAFIVVIAPACVYLLNKAIQNDKDLAVFKEKHKESMKHIAEAFNRITQRCRDRQGWIQGLVRTISRVDKNVAVVATKLGAKIQVSNPGDTVRGIEQSCALEDDFEGIADLEETL